MPGREEDMFFSFDMGPVSLLTVLKDFKIFKGLKDFDLGPVSFFNSFKRF